MQWLRRSFIAGFLVTVPLFISVVAFISYDFEGMGKFCKVFLPWELSANTYAVIIMSITAIYVVLGGMLSVVLTDFAQFILMALSSVVIGVIAMVNVSPETITQVTPAGWHNLFGFNLALDWSGILPAMNSKIAEDGMATMFGLFFMLMVCKGILVSMAGSAPNYDMQRILAAKNPREASLMSAIVSIALVPRWILIGGITLIGLVFIMPVFKSMGGKPDFELMLPYVINNFLPAGLTGLMLAGLLSAFMSTFSATVNAGAAYLVNDVYKRYIKPDAENRTLIRASYLASILILMVGMVVGLYISSINDITQWIVNGLFGGYTAANVLKWYWWRLNGYGYFWGMLVGIACALLVPVVKKYFVPNLQDLYAFPFILLFSAVACIVGSLLTKPTDEETLKKFYRNVRPWGFWRPVHLMLLKDDPTIERNEDAPRDLLNCGVGIIWQLTLVVIPLYVVFRDVQGTLVSLAVLAATTIFLKKFWYDRLQKGEGWAEADDSTQAMSTGVAESV